MSRSFLLNPPKTKESTKPSLSTTEWRSSWLRIRHSKKAHAPSLWELVVSKTLNNPWGSPTSWNTCSSWAPKSSQFTMSTHPSSVKTQERTTPTLPALKQTSFSKSPTTPLSRPSKESPTFLRALYWLKAVFRNKPKPSTRNTCFGQTTTTAENWKFWKNWPKDHKVDSSSETTKLWPTLKSEKISSSFMRPNTVLTELMLSCVQFSLLSKWRKNWSLSLSKSRTKASINRSTPLHLKQKT